MRRILDRVVTPSGKFRPETIQEFFALQLARKLGDTASVRSYVALAELFSEDVLLQAYQDGLSHSLGKDRAQSFRVALRQLTDKEGHERATETSDL